MEPTCIVYTIKYENYIQACVFPHRSHSHQPKDGISLNHQDEYLISSTLHFPLLLKEGWSDLSDLHLEIKPRGQTGVVDSKCLPYFIYDKLRLPENKHVLKPKHNQPPRPGTKALLYFQYRVAWPPPAKAGENFPLVNSIKYP